MVPFIVSALGIEPEKVCYVAYTGKAATVLKQKGCANAITAHKLLYYAKPTVDGKFIFTPKKRFEEDYEIVVVDEISMLPKTMWDLLTNHRVYILAMGDPGQLPPINPEEDNHVLDEPHIFLDEIMRQAQESEIIRLSMHVREGNPLSTFKCEGAQVQIYTPDQVVSGMYDWADQVICATNNKRVEINNFVRGQRGFGPEPAVGDKIISLKNHWDYYSELGDWALTNGAIGTIEYSQKRNMPVPYYISPQAIPYLFTDIRLDDTDRFIQTPIDYTALTEGKSFLTPKQTYLLNKNKNYIDAPFDFAYAYAITCWKA